MRALCVAFASEDPNELDLAKGDMIVVTKMKRDGWWEGHKKDDTQHTGVFPSTFVEITGRAETEGLDRGSSFRKRLESQMKRSMQRKKKLGAISMTAATPSGTPAKKTLFMRVPKFFEHRSDLIRAELQHSEKVTSMIKKEIESTMKVMERTEAEVAAKRERLREKSAPLSMPAHSVLDHVPAHARARTKLSVGIEITSSFGDFLDAWDEIHDHTTASDSDSIARAGSNLFAKASASDAFKTVNIYSFEKTVLFVYLKNK